MTTEQEIAKLKSSLVWYTGEEYAAKTVLYIQEKIHELTNKTPEREIPVSVDTEEV